MTNGEKKVKNKCISKDQHWKLRFKKMRYIYAQNDFMHTSSSPKSSKEIINFLPKVSVVITRMAVQIMKQLSLCGKMETNL